MLPKLSTGIAIKGGAKCEGLKKQGLNRVPAVKKNTADCQDVYTDWQYVHPHFKAKKGGNRTLPLDFGRE